MHSNHVDFRGHPPPPPGNFLRAMRVVKHHAWICGSIGALPLPLVDQVLIAGVLGRMLSEICHVYGVKWSAHTTKVIAASVLGGAHADWIPAAVSRTLHLHAGAQLSGMLVLRPATAGAIAYALGKWFVGHFESGAWLGAKAAADPIEALAHTELADTRRRPA
jgi:uncharacterized protein (DUF697 family)